MPKHKIVGHLLIVTPIIGLAVLGTVLSLGNAGSVAWAQEQPTAVNEILKSKMKLPVTSAAVTTLDKQLKSLIKQADGIRGACEKISENNYCRTHKLWCEQSRKQLTRETYLKFSGQCAKERQVRTQTGKLGAKLATAADRAVLKNLGERLRRLAFFVLKQGYDRDGISKNTTLLADVNKAIVAVQKRFNAGVEIKRHNLIDERVDLMAIMDRVAAMQTACLTVSDNNYCATHSGACDAARATAEQAALDANTGTCHVGADLRAALGAVAAKLDNVDDRQQLADLGEYVWRIDRDAIELKYDRSGITENSKHDLDKAIAALQTKLGN